MEIMKCDRCGKIYMEGDGRNVKSIAIHKQYWDERYSWDRDFIDLCPSCLDKLVDFLENKEETPPFIQGTVDLSPIEGISEKDLEYLTDRMGEEFTYWIARWSYILKKVKDGEPPRKFFENVKGEVKHTCCCNEKKNNMNADPVKGILDGLLKVDRVSPLDIHFGDQFFNYYVVKGENEDE